MNKFIKSRILSSELLVFRLNAKYPILGTLLRWIVLQGIRVDSKQTLRN
jgi:hypothetical protein